MEVLYYLRLPCWFLLYFSVILVILLLSHDGDGLFGGPFTTTTLVWGIRKRASNEIYFSVRYIWESSAVRWTGHLSPSSLSFQCELSWRHVKQGCWHALEEIFRLRKTCTLMFDEHFLSHGKCMHLAPLDYYKNTAMLIRRSKLFQRTATQCCALWKFLNPIRWRVK